MKIFDVAGILDGGKVSVNLQRLHYHQVYRFFQRLFDFVAGCIALVVLSPLFLLIALAIKINDPKGSVFFAQKRVGKNGNVFRMYKFRSMVVDAEAKLSELTDENEVDGPMFKMKEDPRITSVGKFIRKYSLDELPQLWNVVIGKMALVGPRPPLISEVAEYNNFDRQRLLVKPGCTGLWQVSERNNVGFGDMVLLDIAYINHSSLWVDLLILLRTVLIMFKPNGAY